MLAEDRFLGPGQRTLLLMAGSMIFMFALVVLALHPKSHGDNAEAGPDGCCTQCDCATAEETQD